MTSCPDDRALIELVDGELSDACTAEVVDHLTECADCRLSLGRSEASLTYALGGLADTGRWFEDCTPEPDPAPRPAPAPALGSRRRTALPRLAAAAALAAAVLLVALALRPQRDAVPPVDRSTATAPAPETELQQLIARARALRNEAATPPDGRDLIAAGALAAAEARVWTVGRNAARARVRDVLERFPGTPAAREARAMLASAEWEESR